jgi:subfamily B ATP-binding cassette protein MsbA
LVALLWGTNLGSVGPLVKVLLQDKGLHGWADDQIAEAQANIDRRNDAIAKLTPNDFEKRARVQTRLTESHKQLVWMRWIKQNVIRHVPEDKFDTVAMILGLLLIATVFKGTFMYVQEILIGSVVQLTVMGVRKHCFRHCLTLDYQTLASTGTAELMSRFTNDIEQLANGLRVMGIRLIREPLKAAACVTGAFLVNWRLTLLSILVVPAIAIVFHRFGRAMKRASKATMESMAQIYKSLSETFDRIKVVMAFNGARRHRQQFHRENKVYYHKAMKAIRISALTSPTTEVLGVIAIFAATLPGVYLVLRGETKIWSVQLAAAPMGLAELALLYGLLAGTLDPVRKLSSVYGKIKRASAAADRIFSLLEKKSEVTDPVQPRTLPRHSKSIEFDNVSFHYANQIGEPKSRLALRDATLRVSFGEVVAILGENGCGKSTLVSLLPRYFDPEAGHVSIDGVPIHKVRVRDVRQQVGLVTQETHLFDDTIYENIRYGKPAATATEIQKAAEQAYVTSFLDHLPDGIHTVVGVNGDRLSGGQRQRIALARAILRDPSILILDEATSAVDAQSEQLIHQSLSRFVENRTVFIISHSLNPAFLALVTRIVVMDNGQVVASGTHETLMESCETYRQLYQSQSARRAG